MGAFRGETGVKGVQMKTRLTLVLVSLAAGAAFAQDTETPPATRKLSSAEMASQSRDYMTKMQATQTQVQKLSDDAKKKKDVLKLNCVNDKLVQVKGHISVANQSLETFNGAVARGDEGVEQHQYQRLSIIYQKVLVLGTEAENCIGEDVSYVGATKVDIEVDPSVPDDDPTQPMLPLPDPTRPPQATPFA